MEVSDLLNECYLLKEELADSEEYQDVLQAQEEMLNDGYVALLIQYYQTAQSIYNDSVRFQMENQDALLTKLSQAKAVLYQHEKVKKYLESLACFNIILDKVQAEIFNSIGGEEEKISVHYRQAKGIEER